MLFDWKAWSIPRNLLGQAPGYLHEAGFGLHVALDDIGGGTLPAFHLVQNSPRRPFAGCQLSNTGLRDAPGMPFDRKYRVMCRFS
jgi:hypothetical protein